VTMLSALVAVLLLASVHFGVARLRMFHEHPVFWRSFAGGVALAYVFVMLLPKLADAQAELETAPGTGAYGFLVHHAYLAALLGMLVYYGMDAAVEQILRDVGRTDPGPHRRRIRMLVVYLHASGVSGYYFLVAYVLTQGREGEYSSLLSLALFTVAMMLHFTSLDHELRSRYGHRYDAVLRWIFVAATLGGFIVAEIAPISYGLLAVFQSLFAGGLLVLTIKEEVPGRGTVRFAALVAGVFLFTCVALALELLGAK